VALSVWRDESKGIVKGNEMDTTSDLERDDEKDMSERDEGTRPRSSLSSVKDGFDTAELEHEAGVDVLKAVIENGISESGKALWDEIDNTAQSLQVPSHATPLFLPDESDDQEMWDVDEIELQSDGKSVPLDVGPVRDEVVDSVTEENAMTRDDSNVSLAGGTSKRVYGDDWDDMYVD
jgi:hypothetical protein